MNNTIKIRDFYNTQFVNYASYDNIRSFLSLVDGLNNSARKIIHTVNEKNIVQEIKVSQLGSKVSEFTEYLHGNIDGSIVGLAQDFAGSNNLPILYPEGNFGTRFIPEASASRYIYTFKQPYTDKIFRKEDKDILIKQTFEGTNIEPLFFVPTIPMVLINGANNPSTGWRQKLLPRDPANVIKILKQKLNNKKVDSSLLIPKYLNTDCVITPKEDIGKFQVKGVIERTSAARVTITEIPPGISLKSFISTLDELEEKGVINSYTDMSDNNKFKFEVQMNSKVIKDSTDDELLDKLKLIKNDYELYTVIDENNKVKVYENAEQILDHYIRVKLDYTEKRKIYQIQKLREDLKYQISRAFFISSVIKGDIEVNNRKKDDIINQLEIFDKIIKQDDSYDYLLRLPIYSLTKEKVEEIKAKIKETKDIIMELEGTNSKDIWLREIEELESILKKGK